ncbi:MAG: cation transporter [Acidobacteria bacterium]|nr:MAG: cation transporter [Acidobacteriota bacterium]
MPHFHSHPASSECPGSTQQSALKIALGLTSLFTIVEFLGGWFTNSLALMADAGHMLTDVAALGLSIFALWFSSRPATAAKTYGFFRVEILAALANGTTLVVISAIIFYESYYRMKDPPEIKSGIMLSIAALGLVINLACAYFLHRSQQSSLNLRGAFLHVAADAVSSVGAIVAGLLMLFKKWYLADPLTSFLVGGLILYSSWRLVRDSVDILLEGTPAHIDLDLVRSELCKVEGVESIHDLHVWTLTSGMHAMSCHAVLSGNEDRHKILKELSQIVRLQFKIDHTTIQLEETSLQHQEMNSCH